MKRAEIDTRAPFKSVKEAVMLFGDTVLAADLSFSSSSNNNNITINKHLLQAQKQEGTIKRWGGGHGPSMNIRTKTTDDDQLEETKQSLEIAREESMLMANSLVSIKQELEETKRQLQQIKYLFRDSEKQHINPDIEYLKFVANVDETGTEIPSIINTNNDEEEEEEGMEYFQNKPCVKFVNPSAFVHVINTEEGYEVVAAESSCRHPSILMKQKKSSNNNKKKKLTLIPLIGGMRIFFSKKKQVQI